MPSTLLIAAIALPAAVLTTEAAAWWWMHPCQGEAVSLLSYRLPVKRPGVTRGEVEPQVIDTLSCSTGVTATIRGDHGERIDVSFFEWNRSEQQAIYEAFDHAPNVCMTIAGVEFEKQYPPRVYQVDGRQLVFDASSFRPDSGGTLYVYKAPWTENIESFKDSNLLREGPSYISSKSARRFKFRALRNRFAPQYARVITGAVSGFEDEDKAWQFFVEKVGGDLKFEER